MMEAMNVDNILINGYLKMLTNLSTGSKLDLISKLTESIKSDLTEKTSTFKEAFGAFESEKSADDIIADIKSSRTFTRQIEDF